MMPPMETAVLFAVLASSALPLGALLGVWRPPARRVTAALLAFASGALVTAVAFELFEDAFHQNAWSAGVAFAVGASTFVLVDTWLDRRWARRSAAGGAAGLALLAAVTLDGIPENLAMGVALIGSSDPTLLVAIFAANLPEAIVGSEKMREAGLDARGVLLTWCVAALLLGVAVVAGYGGLRGLSEMRSRGRSASRPERCSPRSRTRSCRRPTRREGRGWRGSRRSASSSRSSSLPPSLVRPR